MSARHNRCHDWLAATPQKRWSSSGSIHFRVPFARGSWKGGRDHRSCSSHQHDPISAFFPVFPICFLYLPIYKPLAQSKFTNKNWKVKKFNTKNMVVHFVDPPHWFIPTLCALNSRRPRSCRLKSRPWSKSPEAQKGDGLTLRSFVGDMVFTMQKASKKSQEHGPYIALMMYIILSIFVWAIPRNIMEYPINEVVYGLNISFGSDFSCDMSTEILADFSLKIV